MVHDVVLDISGGMPAPAPMIPSTRRTPPFRRSSSSRRSPRPWPSRRSRGCRVYAGGRRSGGLDDGGHDGLLRAGDNPAMSSREERMALNEAASREINEEIEQAHRDEPP